MKKYILSLCLLLVVGFGGAKLLESYQSPSHTEKPSHQNTLIVASLPESINELIESSDLIVMGTVGDIADKTVESGLQLINYEIVVEQILSGETVTDQIIYSVPGEHDEKERGQSHDIFKTGDKKIFFLSINPDGRTYGIKSYMHMLTIDGPTISYFYPSEDVAVPLDISSSEAFLATLNKELNTSE